MSNAGGFRTGTFRRDAVSGLLRPLCPNRATDSILDIDLAELHREGKRLILLDVDNTLLPWRSEAIPKETTDWVTSAKALGFELCILSNTRHPERLSRLSEKMGIAFIRGKFKPNPAIYQQALREFEVTAGQAIMIGDQLFTDVLGANRCGIDAIWVRQMAPRDFVGTKVSRLGERIVRRQLYRALELESEEQAKKTKWQQISERPVIREFIKFCIVGGSSTVIDLGLHLLLMFYITINGVRISETVGQWAIHQFGLGVAPKDIAFAIFKVPTAALAILNSFYWNRRWTFRIEGKEGRNKQLVKFTIIAITGLVLNTIISSALNSVIPGHEKRSWAVASFIAVIVVSVWNFTGQKLWTFRQKKV